MKTFKVTYINGFEMIEAKSILILFKHIERCYKGGIKGALPVKIEEINN